ncbi:hypothetical protein KDA11_01290 [Candidatus Saccharibacteria bacterium]|nr:hypothetical protein [Candidatus Saccharibacteria bacterium]
MIIPDDEYDELREEYEQACNQIGLSFDDCYSASIVADVDLSRALDGVKEMIIRDVTVNLNVDYDLFISIYGIEYLDQLYEKYSSAIIDDISLNKFGNFIRALKQQKIIK